MPATQRILVTGEAGIIGSALVRHLNAETPHDVLVLDALTYAGSMDTLAPVTGNPRFRFVQADIRNGAALADVFASFRPTWVSHLAAESHVDRSLDAPGAFVSINVMGTFEMLHAAPAHWSRLPAAEAERFRFHHISTDEVFGSLGDTGRFDEGRRTTRARPIRRPRRGRTTSSRPGAQLWPAGASNQLLEQLRSVANSGKADPADDRQGDRGGNAACLWRW